MPVVPIFVVIFCSGCAFLDGSDAATEGEWYWSDGQAFDGALWAPGEPDNTNTDEDCIGFYRRNPTLGQADLACNAACICICEKTI